MQNGGKRGKERSKLDRFRRDRVFPTGMLGDDGRVQKSKDVNDDT